MCGRYSLTADLDDVRRRFSYPEENLILQRRYNIAPTDPVIVVRRSKSDGGKQGHGELMRWGLPPYRSRTGSKGPPMINARDDKVETSTIFSGAFERRRCLIPADGFYEWHKTGDLTVPLRFTLKGGGLFAFAGIWESWLDQNGGRVHSCAIITTGANDLVAPIHDRMPVVLPEEAEAPWIDLRMRDFHTLRAFLKPLPASSMEYYSVSNNVNYVKNDDPTCVAFATEPQQPTLL